MNMASEIIDLVKKVLTDSISWKDFGGRFSAIYFDPMRLQEVDALSDGQVDLFGEINDLIEYTDDSKAKEDQKHSSLHTTEQALNALRAIIVKSGIEI